MRFSTDGASQPLCFDRTRFKKRGARYTGMNYSTMLLLAATAIGFGFLQEGVDNFAHIGGFLGGIAVFSLLLRKK